MINRFKYNLGLTFELPEGAVLNLTSNNYFYEAFQDKFQIFIEAFITVETIGNQKVASVIGNNTSVLLIKGAENASKIFAGELDLDELYVLTIQRIQENHSVGSSMSFIQLENILLNKLAEKYKTAVESLIENNGQLSMLGSNQKFSFVKAEGFKETALDSLKVKKEVSYI